MCGFSSLTSKRSSLPPPRLSSTFSCSPTSTRPTSHTVSPTAFSEIPCRGFWPTPPLCVRGFLWYVHLRFLHFSPPSLSSPFSPLVPLCPAGHICPRSQPCGAQRALCFSCASAGARPSPQHGVVDVQSEAPFLLCSGAAGHTFDHTLNHWRHILSPPAISPSKSSATLLLQ